jgi:hypothetical protein
MSSKNAEPEYTCAIGVTPFSAERFPRNGDDHADTGLASCAAIGDNRMRSLALSQRLTTFCNTSVRRPADNFLGN